MTITSNRLAVLARIHDTDYEDEAKAVYYPFDVVFKVEETKEETELEPEPAL